MRAADGSNPDEEGSTVQFSTATVTIEVPRDQFLPTFQGPYTRQITENANVNDTVLTVNVRDNDKKVGITAI